MAFDPEFLELMNQTITVRPLVEDPASVHSEQSFGAGIEIRTHLSGPSRARERMGAGDVRTDTGRAYLPGIYPAVTVGSRVDLPDGSSGEVNSIETFYDEDGPHHQVLNYG